MNYEFTTKRITSRHRKLLSFVSFYFIYLFGLSGHADGLLRSLVINRLISCKDETTINEAEKMFDQHLKGEKKISADLRTAVYRATLFKGNEKTLDTMIEVNEETLK